MAVEFITKNEFEEKVLQAKQPVVLDFGKADCGPCQALAPVVEEVAKERTDILFYKIDSVSEKELVEKYFVMSVPALIVLKDGVVKKKTIGFKSKESLNGFIDKALEE